MSPPRPTSPPLALSSPSRPVTPPTSTRSAPATLASPSPSSSPLTTPKFTLWPPRSSLQTAVESLEFFLLVSSLLRCVASLQGLAGRAEGSGWSSRLGGPTTRQGLTLTHCNFPHSLPQLSRPSPPSRSSPRFPAPATPRPSTSLTPPASRPSTASSSTVDPASPSRFSPDLMALTASTSPRTSMACE